VSTHLSNRSNGFAEGAFCADAPKTLTNKNSASLNGTMKDWETIADNLSRTGWNCGCISSTEHNGQQFWVAATEREDAGRFIVRAAEKLTAFLELESAIRQKSVQLNRYSSAGAKKNNCTKGKSAFPASRNRDHLR
jgi:hypothetical protein